MKEKITIWQGVYDNFSEAKGELEVFDEGKWQAGLLARLENDLENFNSAASLKQNTIMHEYMLSVVAALLYVEHNQLSILDFGGGLASQYLTLASSIPNLENFDFTIIETPTTCQHGVEKLSNFNNLKFYSNLDEIKKTDINCNFDIIHIGSALQYIENWQELLQNLLNYKPKYLILSDTMAGDIKTFVTTQYYYGKYIPTWFWNIDEFVSTIENLNCKLIHKSLYMGKFFGERGALPMDNMPKTNQLKHACNLIFKCNIT